MSKRVIAGIVISTMLLGTLVSGCTKPSSTSKTSVSIPDYTTASKEETTPSVEETTTEEPTTEAPTTEEPTTAKPTEPPTTAAPTKAAADASGYELIQRAKLTPKKSGNEELDTLVADVLAKTTKTGQNNWSNLRGVYTYFVKNITYKRGMDAEAGNYSESDSATTPTEILWATDLLNSGQGCCYNYSAAFMFCMRALGYDAHIESGTVAKSGGGRTPHCWVVCNFEGVNFTFDPDVEMNQYQRDVAAGKDPKMEMYFCRKDLNGWFYVTKTIHDI